MPRPFDNGEQCGDWDERNCYRCKRVDFDALRSDCEIFNATQVAYFGDGQVSDDIARRMGWQDTNPQRYTWACPEKVKRNA
jgi:hypothetical protein